MAKTKQQNQTAATKAKKKNIKVDEVGRAYITASFNNLIVTITNANGNVVCWSSAGKMGFRGAKRNTPYAAQVTANEVGQAAANLGMKKCEIYVKGPGVGRESAIRSIANAGIAIAVIKDVTGFPHNGCRPPKKRRV